MVNWSNWSALATPPQYSYAVGEGGIGDHDARSSQLGHWRNCHLGRASGLMAQMGQ